MQADKSLHILLRFWVFERLSTCNFLPFLEHSVYLVAAFFRPATTAAFKVSITTGAAGGRTGACEIYGLIPKRRSNRDTSDYT